MAPLIAYPCSICSVPTTLWCSRCHSSWYCSPAHLIAVKRQPILVIYSPSNKTLSCLSKDWPIHRDTCTPFKVALPLTKNPDALPISTVIPFSAIHFPWNEDRARIVRIDCIIQSQSPGPPSLSPIIHPYIGGIRNPGAVVVTHGIGGALLRYPLHVFYRADFLVDGSPPNQSISRLTGGRSTNIWKGDVVALKFQGTRRQWYATMSSSTLYHLVYPPSYLISY